MVRPLPSYKKPPDDIKHVKGWNTITGIAARCCMCRARSEFEKVMYWREISKKYEDGVIGTEVRCGKCVCEQ